jgi:hypothetical protein
MGDHHVEGKKALRETKAGGSRQRGPLSDIKARRSVAKRQDEPEKTGGEA